MMRSSILVAVTLFSFAAACGSDDDDTPDPLDAGGSSSSGAGSSSGGSSSSSSGATGDGGRDAAADVACAVDADCTTGTATGTCSLGLCFCGGKSSVQPDGRCGTTPAPSCTAQGGACNQEPAECSAGQLEGGQLVDMSCGDLVAAVCCFSASACKGPEFRCAGPTDAQIDPVCVNGWRTCPDGYTPILPR